MDTSSMNNVPPADVPMMDGRIRVGPVKGGRGKDILARLQACGLIVPRGEGALYNARMTREGFVVEADGPGVLGYLVDEERLDASSSDLEAFAKPFIAASGQIVIEGSHEAGRNVRILCRTVLEKDGQSATGVKVTAQRERSGARPGNME